MDKYDFEVERLTKNPILIYEAWNQSTPLFDIAGNPETMDYDDIYAKPIGCLTQIRSFNPNDDETIDWVAQTPELTKEIRNDTRIPSNPHFIKVEDLNVFAEWQRKLDKELNRV